MPYKDLMKESYTEPSKDIRRRVAAERDIQSRRFVRSKINCNAKMSSRHIKTHCEIDEFTNFRPHKDHVFKKKPFQRDAN